MKKLYKALILITIGGLIYVLIELIYRGYSHWTMFLLGGLCFYCVGLLNEVMPWDLSIICQSVMGGAVITILEFFTGCIVNIWLGWNVWDYSNMPMNAFGQVCVPFILAWMGLSVIAIVLDDCLRYVMFHEEKPHYHIF